MKAEESSGGVNGRKTGGEVVGLPAGAEKGPEFSHRKPGFSRKFHLPLAIRITRDKKVYPPRLYRSAVIPRRTHVLSPEFQQL